MSRSIHKTIRQVFKGKSVPEVKEMCDQQNPDPDVADLRKKVRYKRAAGRGKYKTKDSPVEYTRHITITEREGHSIVTTDDYELLDFLDDHFTEQNIIPVYISKGRGLNGIEVHTLHFDSRHTPQFLLHVLRQIPASEIERIHNLNKSRT